MKEFILQSYSWFTVLLPFALVLCMALCRSKQVSPLQLVLLLVLGLYLAVVLQITGTGTIYDCKLYQFELRWGEVNLIPFSRKIDEIAYLQNILLFVPFGVLLPLLWSQKESIFAIFASGFGFSLFIELSQLCNHRRTDVDDLLMNTVGALAGYAVAKILLCCIPNLQQQTKWTPWIYIGAMFCGRFLLFNEMGLARLLYGF